MLTEKLNCVVFSRGGGGFHRIVSSPRAERGQSRMDFVDNRYIIRRYSSLDNWNMEYCYIIKNLLASSDEQNVVRGMYHSCFAC